MAMLNLVIVDDESIVRHGIRHSVSWEELNIGRVEEAADGREVLDHLDAWQPDMIITDIIMPVVDGIELIKEVGKRRPSCKFIVLSCANEFNYVKQALLLGASDYLLKMTIRPEDLMESVSKVAKELKKQPVQVPEVLGTALPDDHYKVENFFRDILTYKYTAPQIREISKMYRFQSSLSDFCVIVMRVNMKEALHRFDPDGSRLIGFSIINLLQETVSTTIKRRDFDYFKVEHDEYVFIMDSLAGESLQALTARAEDRMLGLAELISRVLKIEVCFGVSSLCQGPEQLLGGYRYAQKASERQWFHAHRKVFHYEQRLEEANSADKDRELIAWFDFGFRERLLHSLSYGMEREAMLTIDEHFARLREGECSVSAAKLCVDKAISILNVYTMEVNSYLTAGGAEPMEAFGNQPFNVHWNLDRTQERMKAYCHKLIERKSRLSDRSGKKIILQIESYLNQNYGTKVSLEQVARHFHMNKNYLSQLFKTETGVNFTHYLNQLRIEKAKLLMLNSSDTLSEISDKVGFSDFRYFSRVFKRLTLQSPSRFKSQKNVQQ